MTPSRPDLLHPVHQQVETTLFRALAVLRFVVAGYAVALQVSRWRTLEHPLAGWVVIGVVVAWTLVATWAYDAPRRRGLPLLLLDIAVAAATLLVTPYVQTQAMLDRNAPTMPSFWVMAPVLAWAVLRGWVGGLAAALAMVLFDLSVRSDPTHGLQGNLFLLLLAAGVVGYSVGLVRDMSEARAAAERRAAAMAERARLARAVHDGVLQVLALVQRRGAELGGEAAELGRLAGEQERALRALVQADATLRAGTPTRDGGGSAGTGEVDLAAALGALQSATVTVSTPAAPVPLDGAVAAEVVAVVRACLDNVARHVGETAPAWVLLEDLGADVTVSVRDEGPGIPPGRLEQAEAEGRMGVSGSIRGRVRDLGGSVELVTGPTLGTEWELSVPKRPAQEPVR